MYPCRCKGQCPWQLCCLNVREMILGVLSHAKQWWHANSGGMPHKQASGVAAASASLCMVTGRRLDLQMQHSSELGTANCVLLNQEWHKRVPIGPLGVIVRCLLGLAQEGAVWGPNFGPSGLITPAWLQLSRFGGPQHSSQCMD